MSRYTTVPAICAWALMCAVLGAAEVWDTKPFTSWSDKEVKKILSDSPWAGKASLTHANAGGTTQPIQDTVIVIWTSALPVRQATVREAIGQNGTVTPDHEQSLAAPQGTYKITLEVQGGSARNAASVAKQTELRRDKKAAMLVAQSRMAMRDRDGRIVEMPARGAGAGVPGGPPQAGAPPAGGGAPPAGRGGGGIGGGGFGGGGFGGGGFGGGGGSTLVILEFSQGDPITLEDKEVELVSRLGNYNVKKKFKLKDMVVNGRLEL